MSKYGHESLSEIEKNRNNSYTGTWVMECTTLTSAVEPQIKYCAYVLEIRYTYEQT